MTPDLSALGGGAPADETPSGSMDETKPTIDLTDDLCAEASIEDSEVGDTVSFTVTGTIKAIGDKTTIEVDSVEPGETEPDGDEKPVERPKPRRQGPEAAGLGIKPTNFDE